MIKCKREVSKMQIRVVLYIIATLLICLSSPLAAQPAKNTKGTGIEYAYLDLQLQWHLVKATPAPNGVDREYVAELRVCHAQIDGCHWESTRESVFVREPLNPPRPIGPSNDTPWTEATSTLTGRVITTLGENGWELIGNAPLPTFWTPPSSTVVWFKRTRKP
jgi:hypothetical protein